MRSKKSLTVLLAALVLGAGTVSAAGPQGGTTISTTRDSAGGTVSVTSPRSAAQQVGTVRPDFTFNVPVRLNDMHPTLGKVVVQCVVSGPSSGSRFLRLGVPEGGNGMTEVEVPIRGGNYNGTVTVPVRNGVARTYDGREVRVTDPQGRTPDAGTASQYSCALRLYGNNGALSDVCEQGVGSRCSDAPWAIRRASTPFVELVQGALP